MPGQLPITSNAKSHENRSERGDFFKPKNTFLHLGDGAVFPGISPDWQTGNFVGEVVFNTGMTGYIESLTDPSYTGQILVFTYPLIGNYGAELAAAESAHIQVAGVVVSEIAPHFNHTGADSSLIAWLRAQHIPIISGVDTRALTKHLRTRGTMPGTITTKKHYVKTPQLKASFVSVDKPVSYNAKRSKTIIVVDCGAKENIIRSLSKLPAHIKRVPLHYDYTQEDYDGVFVSNGPGDPTDYMETIAILRKALKIGKPVFGICLGSQLMALAAGATTYKLAYGHRGHNQPCQEADSDRCFITSQNHGYAIDEKSLPKGWEVWFRNLNDGSVEGIKHKNKPFSSVQFHPEACPGPTDTAWLFERFYKSI